MVIGIFALILRALDILFTNIFLGMGATELNILALNDYIMIISTICIIGYMVWDIALYKARNMKDLKSLFRYGIFLIVLLIFPVIWNLIGIALLN